jgi:hypothetical protein
MEVRALACIGPRPAGQNCGARRTAEQPRWLRSRSEFIRQLSGAVLEWFHVSFLIQIGSAAVSIECERNTSLPFTPSREPAAFLIFARDAPLDRRLDGSGRGT